MATVAKVRSKGMQWEHLAMATEYTDRGKAAQVVSMHRTHIMGLYKVCGGDGPISCQLVING